MDCNKEVTAWSSSLQKQGLYATIVMLWSSRSTAVPAAITFYRILFCLRAMNPAA
ncbi:MAG: hypothetical protein PVJ86_11910 [Phycisphaerales bacterium]